MTADPSDVTDDNDLFGADALADDGLPKVGNALILARSASLKMVHTDRLCSAESSECSTGAPDRPCPPASKRSAQVAETARQQHSDTA